MQKNATWRYIQAVTGWCTVYLALAIMPLGLVLIDAPDERRAFWLEFSVGLGLVGFMLLILQFALTARFRGIGKPFGIDALLQFHRHAGLLAFNFILAHALIAIVADPAYLAFLDPRQGLLRAGGLTFVLVALAALIITTLRRTSFGLPYEWWRLLHGVIATFVVIIGLGHSILVGHYFEPLWKQTVWVLLTGGAISLLLYTRVVKPMIMRKRPWRITSVRKENVSTWTIALEPVGHGGIRFQPGQYAWLTIHDSPFTLQQHPFSFSCSADSGKVEFTIKQLGDFTRTIQNMKPETVAYIEGPYGAFSLENSAPGAVFIVGGIGITPVMSMLRTARDRGDNRSFTLIYGHADVARGIFGDELDEMAASMNLKLVHVLEEPHEGWNGETGMLSREVIERHADERMKREFDFLFCGPPPMMDVVENALHTIGVPPAHIRSERFDIV